MSKLEKQLSKSQRTNADDIEKKDIKSLYLEMRNNKLLKQLMKPEEQQQMPLQGLLIKKRKRNEERLIYKLKAE